MTTKRKVLFLVLAAVFLFQVGFYCYAYWQVTHKQSQENSNSVFVDKSYHDEWASKKNYEDAWIGNIDKKEGIVLVTMIDSKMSIIFKPAAGDLQKFHIGWIAPVTFQCTKWKNEKCDFEVPYKLFVSNGLVEVKQLIPPK